MSNYFPEVEQLVKKLMEQTGENRSAILLFQSIVVSIQIGSASCILGLTRLDFRIHIYYLKDSIV